MNPVRGDTAGHGLAQVAVPLVVGSPPGSFPIVGIGASAGGLEAFRRLLGSLPKDTGMAYVLVQHLDPSHDSILADLLAQSTQLEVSEVKGDVCVAPNQIYVIPPSKGLILVDGTLKLVPRSSVGPVPMPIDSFLRTLAEVQGSQAIGVILSGMGSDGTLGLQAIEEAGGITFAQEPSSARNEDMPRSAIRGGRVDFVLPPEGIALELTRLGQHPYLGTNASEPAVIDVGPHAQVRVEGKDDEEPDSLARILELLRQASGTDFGGYKKATLRRRIARRMALSRIQTLEAYAAHLDGDATEAGALYEDCLISVTSFFRDPAAFEALSEQLLSLLSRDSPADEPLRMWVPGCATGEEVYSIAMCVLERAAELSRNPSLQIFATDLSDRALVRAREGSYPLSISRDVSAERLRRFFSKVGDQYQINKAVREMCVFARHDLTRDPPYSRMDLISCRNVLIYLEPPLQEMLFATFHYALRPEGLLMVGPAETVGASSAFFSPVDEKHRIYSSLEVDGPPRILSVRRDVRPLGVGAHPPLARKVSGAAEVSREADRILLDRFGPPGVIIDANLNVLEFRGDTDPFLDHSHGKASLNLEHLLRRGLLIDLRQAIEEVRRTGLPAERQGLQVNYRREVRSVAVEVAPIKGRASDVGCLLVLFEMESVPAAEERRPSTPQSVDTAGIKDRELARLGQALAEATEYVHTLVREHESAVEELQASTEEALSGNEELQSLNEELQTAKEEIQSANEELATLNQELQDRNLQLARFNDDIQRGLDNANALVNAVPQPLVILDAELRVEKANRAFYATFDMTPETTRDRLLAEIGGGQWSKPALLTALNEVLTTGTTVDDLEVDAEFPRLGFRNMFLNALSLHPRRGSTGCILLAIEDRTEVTRAERGREAVLALEHDARERAEAADHLKDQFVATVSHELRGPLNVISGWMNILLAAGKSPDDAVLAKALAAIGRGVAAQTRLLSDLIDHSRIVTGKVELQRAAIDLWTVAEAAIVGVRAAADAKEISLILSGNRVTSMVLGDFDRMQQVLWNLFLNAVKFTPPGGSVRISIGRVGNQVHITVKDSGRGIPASFLPYVFDRFRQAEGSSNRMQQGLGLGLTLVRELVELHGGTVSATSPGVDRGATFTVVLPIPTLLLPAPQTDQPPPPESEGPTSIRSPGFLELPLDMLHGARLLVVDDEADARDALVSLLERYGALVRTAASVAEALAAVAAELPDVLISDLGMSGEDGYELIRRVRLLHPDEGGVLPSLAVSAYATEEHRKKVMNSGFQAYLEKPVAPAELVTEVARLAVH
jgi:two-component system CheB/CheR fusion protein